ncbi:MAG: hypothetical protein ACKOEM_12525, partial [Planctomycetia bacterium]
PLSRRNAMADESDKKRLVRFDFPRGASAESIARALNEYRRRILDEAAERRQEAERAAGETQPEPPEPQ